MVVMIAYILKGYNVLSCRSCKLLVMVSMEFSFHFQSINMRLRGLWAFLLIYTVQHFAFLINEGGHLLPWSDTLLSLSHFPWLWCTGTTPWHLACAWSEEVMYMLCCMYWILFLFPTPSGSVCMNCLLLFSLCLWYRHGSLTHSVSLVPPLGWWQES